MKKISFCIPCFNEEDNVIPLAQAIINEMEKIRKYDYEIIFADNASTDNTQTNLKKIALSNKKVKIIINNRNFGGMRSGWNCLKYASGDAIISLPSDFQVPTELIKVFIEQWEKGELVVLCQKVQSRERKYKRIMRTMYYKIISFCSDHPQYEHVTGSGLFDQKVIKEIMKIGELTSTRHLIAELGYSIKLIPFEQPQRKNGKSSYNIWSYFDFAINSLISTSTTPIRIATVIGCITSLISFIFGVIYLIYKLMNWNSFSAGMAPIIISVFFLGSIQILLIGLIGEYIANIIKKISKVPFVIEKELINFDKDI